MYKLENCEIFCLLNFPKNMNPPKVSMKNFLQIEKSSDRKGFLAPIIYVI